MKLRLKGEIHPELESLGCKAGDVIKATPDPVSKVGCMHFTISKNHRLYDCSIWPDNYDVLKPKTKE